MNNIMIKLNEVSFEERFRLARYSKDANTLNSLAHDTEWRINELAASRPECYRIREAIASNPYTDLETLKWLVANDDTVALYAAVAGNPNTDTETLRELANINIEDYDIRNAVAINPNTDAETFKKVSRVGEDTCLDLECMWESLCETRNVPDDIEGNHKLVYDLSLRFTKDGDQEYYDLIKESTNEIVCCDGESCKILYEDVNCFELAEEDTQIRFKLSRNELNLA